MTKGKYTAKAANRMANLDNELLQQAVAERDALRAELDVERLKVQAAERNLHSRAIREAGSIARADVQVANSRADTAERKAESLAVLAAETIRDLLIGIGRQNPEASFLPRDLDVYFNKFVGSSRGGTYASEVLDKVGCGGFSSREARRLTTKKVIGNRNADGREQTFRDRDLLSKFKGIAANAGEEVMSDVEEADQVAPPHSE